jgi:hypothetical protein
VSQRYNLLQELAVRAWDLAQLELARTR